MDYDFPLFAAAYYDRLGWQIPEVHYKIFLYLEDEDKWNINRTKVLLLWRGIGKSTITDLWIAYKLSKNPALRFLILSADKDTARKSSMDILTVLRVHPFTQHVLGQKKDREQRRDQFFVQGNTDNRNPSVRAIGVMSNITGSRADYIIYDDVEVPKNSGTDTKRDDLRRKVSESQHLLVPELGRKLFIGTYHDSESIYDDQILNGASSLRVPILKNAEGEYPYIKGESQWPERFDDQYIAQKQKECTGKAEFYSQYMLIPSSIKDSILDATKFHIYQDEITFGIANGRSYAKLGNKLLRSVSCWWDPSMSVARGDDSVVSVVFTCDDNIYYIHRVVAVKGDTDEQCMAVRRVALDMNVPVVCVETNGIGAMLPPMLIKHLAGTGIAVDGVHSPPTTSKNNRIVAAFETALYSNPTRCWVHQSVADGPFINQIRDFDPSTTKNRDDYIDATANAILREPNFFGGVSVTNSTAIRNWMHQGSHDLQVSGFTF